MSASGSGEERRGPGRPPNRSGIIKSHGFSTKTQREKGQKRLQKSRERSAEFQIVPFVQLEQSNGEGFISVIFTEVTEIFPNPPLWAPYQLEIHVQVRENASHATIELSLTHEVVCNLLQLDAEYVKEQFKSSLTGIPFYDNAVRYRTDEVRQLLTDKSMIIKIAPKGDGYLYWKILELHE